MAAKGSTTSKQEEVSHFIRLIKGIAPQYLRYACTHGACHRFYLILKNRFPSAVPYDLDGGHVVTRIFGKYWDIYGEHITEVEGAVVEFSKQGLERMSSCHFDEAYLNLNPQILMDYDKKKEST